jgi:hypothetical protein
MSAPVVQDVTVVVVRPDTTNQVVVSTDPTTNVAVDASTGGGTSTALTSGSAFVKEVDVVGVKGDKGDMGEPGLQGPVGPPGASAINPVVWNQDVPISVWTVVHNLNTFPLVTVVDSANTTVLGDVSYLDLNTLQIAFNSAFSGTAYII